MDPEGDETGIEGAEEKDDREREVKVRNSLSTASRDSGMSVCRVELRIVGQIVQQFSSAPLS
jgi:hypothetical protein